MFVRGLIVLILCCLTACSSNNHSKKQVLRLNLYTEPPTLDPRKATDSTSVNVLLNLFEGLTRVGDDHKPHPALAEEILVSDDKRVYTFKLRDAYWSNGDKVTAEDFLYTWQTTLDPKFPAPLADKLYVIENAAAIKEGKLPMSALGVRVLDSKTLEVTLKNPTPYFLELTAVPLLFAVNRNIDKKNPDWSAKAGPDYVTNGPFKLDKWEHESEIIASKNPLYWDAQAVKLDALQLAMIDDTTTEFYMFEMNELDWAGSPLSNLPPEFVAALKKDAKETKIPIHFYPATAVYYYKINTQHKPLNNVNIRKALSYAINRKDIVEHITQAGQKPATALVPYMPGWKNQALFDDGDTKLAKELFTMGLRELGLTVEHFPKLTLSYNTNREHQKIAQAVQQQWKQALGIEVELLHFDWKVYLNKISSQDYQIARMGWVGDYNDPVSFLEPFKSKDGNNDTGWENPTYSAYLEEAQSETDSTKRAEILRKAEALLISEMPVIPIYYIVHGYLKKPYVEGVYVSPLGIADFKKAYIKR